MLVKGFAPAADRNRQPILAVLQEILAPDARVLEIASGTGQHAALFTERMPSWIWQPTDASSGALESIEAYRAESTSPGFLAPLRLDTRDSEWPAGPYDAVLSANLIHIAPWSVCLALLDGAARVLSGE